MRLVIFLGPPGVGKGTAAKRVVESLGFHWLSTGDVLRAATQSRSEFGRRITEYIDSGRLVPDDLMIELVEGEIEKLPPDTRLLLDGFPRTLPQAVALDENLKRQGHQVHLVVELQADYEELVRRILGRSHIEGRADDTIATLHHRHEVFQSQTAPLIDYYREQGKLQSIHAMGSPDNVFERISHCIRKFLEQDVKKPQPNDD